MERRPLVDSAQSGTLVTAAIDPAQRASQQWACARSVRLLAFAPQGRHLYLAQHLIPL